MRLLLIEDDSGPSPIYRPTGDLVVNLDTKTVEVSGARVHVAVKEYQMLELLSLRKGATLTKEMFLNHLYGGMDEPALKIIEPPESRAALLEMARAWAGRRSSNTATATL
jgi:hypothetical protein